MSFCVDGCLSNLTVALNKGEEDINCSISSILLSITALGCTFSGLPSFIMTGLKPLFFGDLTGIPCACDHVSTALLSVGILINLTNSVVITL